MEMQDIACPKGSISAEDMGFLYGFSIFETFLADVNKNVFLLEKHMERLINSTTYFNIRLGCEKEELIDAVTAYIDKHDITNSIIRVTVSAGNSQRGVASSLHFYIRPNIYSLDKINSGCSLCTTDVRKSESSILIKHKTSNYLENYLVLNTAISKGFDDVVFMNTKNYVTETAKGNIFLVKDGVLHTPEVGCGLLPGIIRQWVLEKANSIGIECIEGAYYIEDLYNCDEVFVTNSAMGIMHVKGIHDKKTNKGGCGRITNLFKAGLHRCITYI